MGTDNDCIVYASSGFTATSSDELTFCKGAPLKILRKSNTNEFDWWWASCDGREGYVPQYLLAVGHVTGSILDVTLVFAVVTWFTPLYLEDISCYCL